ncbi:hypothetical protein [Sinorhizobium fredii]|uniref:Alpha/beta hydrolase n=1 Tax=Rhizobium fredii TaxID=380 RepID=A0A2L0HBM3_RHIFR|nr:hypothetical protein [Sinorhizobium fredii]AUX78898.1 hypothetical protein NXT3_PB00239 [Sinorhizobium fredii]
MRLLFIHGRSQEGRSEQALKEEWLGALNRGLSEANKPEIAESAVAQPFYGDVLLELSKTDPANADELKRSSAEKRQGADFVKFMAEAAVELSAKGSEAGIAAIQPPPFDGDDVYRTKNPACAPLEQSDIDDMAERGVQNWSWVIATVRHLDETFPAFSEWSIGRLLRDVYLYLTDEEIQAKIDEIVERHITSEPTLVVGHSLGTVVAYNILRKKERNITGFITLGSPLGIQAIRKRLEPPAIIRPNVETWANLYDTADIVALNPLNSKSFAIFNKPIEDVKVHNDSDNRHNIKSYISDVETVSRIHKFVSSGEHQ